MNKTERIKTAKEQVRAQNIAFREAALRENERNRLLCGMLEKDYEMYRIGKHTLSSLPYDNWKAIALPNIINSVDTIIEQMDFQAQATWLVDREMNLSGEKEVVAGGGEKRAILGIGLFSLALLLLYCLFDKVVALF